MNESASLLASALRILDGAERDLARHRAADACVAAYRGALLATEAWLRSVGQVTISASVRENVSFAPDVDPEVRAAAATLDRHRIEEGYPHRSAPGIADPEAEAAGVVAAGRRVLAFAAERIG